jgi:hypothetical protein
MRTIGQWIGIACGAVVLTGCLPALATPPAQQLKPAAPAAQNVPRAGDGRNEQLIASAAPAPAAPEAGAQTLPPKKPLPTLQKIIAEHFAAFNTCDWQRLMAQYDDDMAFLSKDGAVVKGRQAIGEMFRKALAPHSAGGVCGITLTPEQTIVVGNTANIVWRADAPFLAEPYRGSEAFETRNGLLVVQVTTWDPSAMKMKK